jgi:hypothetical protein
MLLLEESPKKRDMFSKVNALDTFTSMDIGGTTSLLLRKILQSSSA